MRCLVTELVCMGAWPRGRPNLHRARCARVSSETVYQRALASPSLSRYQIILLGIGDRGTMDVGNLHKVVAWRRVGRESNLRPLDHESDTLTTTPPSHVRCRCKILYVSKFIAASRGSPCDSIDFLFSLFLFYCKHQTEPGGSRKL